MPFAFANANNLKIFKNSLKDEKKKRQTKREPCDIDDDDRRDDTHFLSESVQYIYRKKGSVMGVCLCKDKTEDGHWPNTIPISDGVDSGLRRHPVYNDRMIALSETVDRLVRETLEVIGSIVDK